MISILTKIMVIITLDNRAARRVVCAKGILCVCCLSELQLLFLQKPFEGFDLRLSVCSDPNQSTQPAFVPPPTCR